ncbi:Transposase, type 1 [Popillia japonica]|uniref:Transposase, type 1 n=1 Tax=Popillia japonica TaxID=7064 RepID=A0AAW1NKG2_POPJA
MASHNITSQSQGQADNLSTQGYGNGVLLVVFWDRHGVLLVEFMQQETIHNKRRGLLTSEFCCCMTMSDPILPLNASDFHLFRYLKEFFGGKRFAIDDEVKEAVQGIIS